MDSRARELCSIGKGLFTKKEPWDSLCQDLAENFYPMRADFTSSLSLGDDFQLDTMDSYPLQARETLGNMPNAMLRQGDWFKVQTGIEDIDEDPEVSRWLEHATVNLRRLVYDRRANFTAATIEADHDWVAFGNPVISVEESPTRNHLFFRAWHPRDCAWMVNDVAKIDHLQRKMKKSARNLVARFGDKVHPDIKRANEKDPTQDFNVRHIVLPMEELYGDDKAKRRKYKDKPFLSLYIDVDHETYLGEAGLPVFNYIVPRWRTLTSVLQGFSPASINSLADARMLQRLSMIILESGEKAVDPATIAKGEIFRDAVNLYAGGMTYVDLQDDEKLSDVFQTIQTGQGLGIGLEIKQDVRQLIAEAFLLNKLFLPDTRAMTAYETSQRMEEFRRSALPFFGPIEAEYHLPLLDASFQLAINNRMFDMQDMPDMLQEREVTFNFTSPLNTAEGRANVAAFQESVQILAGASRFDNSIPSTMNFKQMTKDAVRGTGAKPDWFADEAVQASAEDQANQATQLQEAAAALREGAGVAQDVAGASVALQQAGLV
ncbi:portal protein [Brucella anthropi]|uniref:portal protein n=1 Tax=Brucella anthropi TaxID=529 RepID=UPI00384C3795